MALTINICNTGQTTQNISLFSTGASGVSDFIDFSANGFQAIDTSGQIAVTCWTYLGNNNWVTSNAYTIGFILINIADNSMVNVGGIPIGSGLTPSQVSTNVTNYLISNGYLNSVVAVSLSFDTNSNPIITYNFSNPDYNCTDVRQTFIPANYLTPMFPTNNKSVLASNPNIQSSQSVSLPVIQNSTNGYSYLVKSMYVVSTNPQQLIVPINYGMRDANGDIAYQTLANTIDPLKPNSVALRTDGMNDFVFDDSTVFNFDSLAQTCVSIKYEFEQLGYDEIKKQAVGVELRKKFAKMEMENEEKADDFQNFYFFQ
jgi:hypothetical protein